MKTIFKLCFLTVGIMILISSCKKEEKNIGNTAQTTTSLSYDTIVTVNYVFEAMGQVPYSSLQIAGGIIGANFADQSEFTQNPASFFNFYSPPASSQQHITNICATNNIVLTKPFKLSKANGTEMQIIVQFSGGSIHKTTQITFTNNTWHFSNNTDFKYDLSCQSGKWVVYFKAN